MPKRLRTPALDFKVIASTLSKHLEFESNHLELKSNG